eukprot:TRINITY_DN8658_c0_g1_i1.p1 TRINITY_DN8658_c0_g1~~TRINITY_DN8658_c0_g1_i1.p1  ORF type:complete len:251 (-),score=50.33 TRINITY_DN8658_c0_g1_i1:174-926(-)
MMAQLLWQPPVTTAARVDAIVIPGLAREADEDGRAAFEVQLLRDYFLDERQRKPMLLLCGGVYRLAALGAELQHVQGHCAGKMMSLHHDGRVLNNTEEHQVELVEESAMARRIWGNRKLFPVNSVHSQAIASLGEQLQPLLEVMAYSGPACLKDGRPRLARNQLQMGESRCIEALASRRGPPLVAVQWHPEAFITADSQSPHHQVLFYVLEQARARCVRHKQYAPNLERDYLALVLAHMLVFHEQLPYVV